MPRLAVLWTFKTVQKPFCFPAEDGRRSERAGPPELSLSFLDRTGLGTGQPEEHEPEVKAHALGTREAPRERAELRERDARPRLVEANDGGSDSRFGVPRLETDGRVVLPLSREPVTETLQREAVQELRLHVARARAAGERGDLPRGDSPVRLGGAPKVGTKCGRPRGKLGCRTSSARPAEGESGSTRAASRQA